jgi:predicted nucleic acid-binding protein
MSSSDVERRRKLNDEFDNIFREHDRLQQDLNSEQHEQYQSLLTSIDKWEEDAIKRVEKTARTARNDVQRLLKDTSHQLQDVLNDTVTEDLREILQQKDNLTEFHIDKWLANLSEIRRQFEAMPSVVDFSHNKVIELIKVKRKYPLKICDRLHLDHRQFNFENIRGHPIFSKTEHLISCTRPATILSQNKYSHGTHYFRFRIEQTTDELFFGIISDKDHQKLKENLSPIQSIHGWWNIDRRVISGRKEPYVSTLNIYNGDEIILIMNCDARQIFLEYPSMSKLNTIQLSDDIREYSLPWKLLIEIGKPGRCLLKLLEWGKIAHGTSHPERRLHCFCLSNQ